MIDELSVAEMRALHSYVRWCDEHGLGWKSQLGRDWLANGSEWPGPWRPVSDLRRFGTPLRLEAGIVALLRARYEGP